jgi:hypothetical protein
LDFWDDIHERVAFYAEAQGIILAVRSLLAGVFSIDFREYSQILCRKAVQATPPSSLMVPFGEASGFKHLAITSKRSDGYNAM